MNAITLALLDAGVPIKSLVAAMTCMIDKDSKQIVMDPTAEELEVMNTQTRENIALTNY